jgi:Holliday junction resolvase RusA-like endonuclease
MKVVEIILECEPVAKARARTVSRNGKIRSYTPDKTKIGQETIKRLLEPYLGNCFSPHIGIKLTCCFYRTKSIWLPKRETLPFRKSDLDNFIKGLSDSISKSHSKKNTDRRYLIPDDAQITTLVARKRWSPTGRGYITMRLEEDTE